MNGKILIILALSGLLAACGGHNKPKNTAVVQRFQVKSSPLHKSLHFTGTIQPIKEHTLTSPMDAVVESINFHYGQWVKKGDVIATLSSNELQKQYNDALTEYLKAKDSYTVAKSKFVGTQDLWDAGLISKNNFVSEKSSLNTSRVTLMQAKRKLMEMLDKIDDPQLRNITDLSLADFEKIRSTLSADHNLIRIKAPGDGVLLYPPKSADDKNARVAVGSTLKSGQVMGLIGDMRGISIEIDVPEIDIDAIQPGMQASISGVAFAKHALQGTLVAINAQASNSGSGGLPSFSATVEVKHLSEQERDWVKVGMSAAIELSIDSENKIIVPIAAIKREQGKSIVTVLAQNNREKRVITTGSAQADSVVVESGLKIGEVVVYD